VAKAKGRLRGKQPQLSPRQEAHLVAPHQAGEYTVGEYTGRRVGGAVLDHPVDGDPYHPRQKSGTSLPPEGARGGAAVRRAPLMTGARAALLAGAADPPRLGGGHRPRGCTTLPDR